MENKHKKQMEKELMELKRMFDTDVKELTNKYYKLFETMTFESISIENSLNNIAHENIEDVDTEKMGEKEKIDIFNKFSELRKKRRYISTKIDLIKFMSSTLKNTLTIISNEVEYKRNYKFFTKVTDIDKIKTEKIKKMEVVK